MGRLNWYDEIIGRYSKLQGWFPSSTQKFTFRNMSQKLSIMDIFRSALIPQQKESLITRIFPTYVSRTEHMHNPCEMQVSIFFPHANLLTSHNFNI